MPQYNLLTDISKIEVEQFNLLFNHSFLKECPIFKDDVIEKQLIQRELEEFQKIISRKTPIQIKLANKTDIFLELEGYHADVAASDLVAGFFDTTSITDLAWQTVMLLVEYPVLFQITHFFNVLDNTATSNDIKKSIEEVYKQLGICRSAEVLKVNEYNNVTTFKIIHQMIVKKDGTTND